MATKRNLTIDETFQQLVNKMGSDESFYLHTKSGTIMVANETDFDPYNPVSVEKADNNTPMVILCDYFVKVGKVKQISTYGKQFLAAEIIAKIILIDAIDEMPDQMFIDAITLSFLENIGISVTPDDLAKDFQKYWMPKDVARSFAVRELAKNYYYLRYKNAQRVQNESYTMASHFVNNDDLNKDQFSMSSMGIIALIKEVA